MLTMNSELPQRLCYFMARLFWFDLPADMFPVHSYLSFGMLEEGFVCDMQESTISLILFHRLFHGKRSVCKPVLNLSPVNKRNYLFLAVWTLFRCGPVLL